MALPIAAYNPTDGITNVEAFPDSPGSSAAFRLQFQTLYDQARGFVNSLKTALESTVSGSSGADQIRSTGISGLEISPGILATTVRDQIASLAAKVVSFTLGAIGDNTITDAKLNPDIKIGSLAALTTTAKTSVQVAVNELDTKIGRLTSLSTTEKSSLVSAINELYARFVITTMIADLAVTSEKIFDGAITDEKLGTDVPRILYGTGEMPEFVAEEFPEGTLYGWYTA